MEGSWKWGSLFILFYLLTVTEHLPYKDFMHIIYVNLYKQPCVLGFIIIQLCM